MLIVIQDLVDASGILVGQGGTPRNNFQQVGGQTAAGVPPTHALQPFLGSFAHGESDAFAGYRRQLPNVVGSLMFKGEGTKADHTTL